MIRVQAHKKGKPMKTTISKISMIVALALTLTASTNVALAQSAYPPARLLAAHWWQWALSAPTPENPLLDTTGQFAAVNQQGRVWFVAGTISGTVTRTFTVPVGKALFFPIVNVFDVEDGISPSLAMSSPGGVIVFRVPQPVQTAQGIVSSIIATATGLSCEVDGVPLQINAANLEQSTPFSTFLPADNIVGVPPGVYFPFVDSGYYVLLPPLSTGFHTIHFAGTITFSGSKLTVDVTDNITVQ
jgi:hypothetical protein